MGIEVNPVNPDGDEMRADVGVEEPAGPSDDASVRRALDGGAGSIADALMGL